MIPLRAWLSFLLSSSLAIAQAAGLRSAAQETPQVPRLGPPDAATAERVITIEAAAEVRVAPTEVRVVFAICATGADAAEASAGGRARLDDTKARLLAAGRGAADLDVDFIAVVPIYTWQVEQQSGKNALVEKQSGVRVQYNLHVRVADEAAALAAIEAATAGNGVELLAVDYWSDALTEQQVAAQKKALAAAQQKAALLLAVFGERPKPINVHEQTHVLFPQHLYQDLPRAEDSAGGWYSRDELPRVPASRPLKVYYRGLFADVDAVETAMSGRREIEIVSTVRLYFLAPERPQLAK